VICKDSVVALSTGEDRKGKSQVAKKEVEDHIGEAAIKLLAERKY